MNIVDRINEIAINENISLFALEKKIGATKNVLSRAVKNKTDIQSKWITSLVNKYPQYDKEWLLTGEGEMLRIEKKEITIHEGEVPNGAIPFYNLPVSAGHSPFDIEGAIEPDGYVIDIPGMNSTEALLPVRGFSMQPEIKDGSIVGVKAVSGWDYLNTQNKYLIITHEDRMIKYIEHDDNNNEILWCISPNYKRFPILKNDIVNVYRITFVMNYE